MPHALGVALGSANAILLPHVMRSNADRPECAHEPFEPALDQEHRKDYPILDPAEAVHA